MTAKLCERGCGKMIIKLGKTLDQGSTGWFEVEDDKIVLDKEHTYAKCDRLIAAQKKTEDDIAVNKAIHGGGLDSFNTI